MDINAQNKAREERRRAMMEGDFNPGYTREDMPSTEQRFLNAAEYSAYQLGKLNRNLEDLIAVLKRGG